MDKAELVRRIKKALKHGLDTHSYDDLVAGLDSGTFQMFADDDGVVVTEIRVAPQKRYLNIVLVAGELETLKNMQPRLVEFGRANGCEFILGSGRLGWEKVATPGWKRRWVAHTLDI